MFHLKQSLTRVSFAWYSVDYTQTTNGSVFCVGFLGIKAIIIGLYLPNDEAERVDIQLSEIIACKCLKESCMNTTLKAAQICA